MARVLKNHLKQIVAVDFFVVPTLTFRILCVFAVLSHDRRRIRHVNVTASPSAEWTSRQIVQAFPWDEAPRFVVRDGDRIYGEVFQRTLERMLIEEVRTAPRSPWQNAYVERVIGTLRRECTDHVIVSDERHLRRILREYVTYYNEHRCHQSLDGDTPCGRDVEPPDLGPVIERPMAGGLHNRYSRRAA